jgi:GGDEF domain-containing protein
VTTQEQICRTFTQQRPRCQEGKPAWLIKGDFDHFKLTNDLYGPLITDYLLDWSLEVIETQLREQQKRWGCADLLCSVMGDDLTIYIPPASLAEEDIQQLLWKIREAVWASFWQRYFVGTLPLPPGFFASARAGALARLRAELEKMDVVLDFAARRQGFLLLLPVDADGGYRQALERVLSLIQRASGKALPALDLRLDWICGPQESGGCIFNQGYLDPPVVSFAACPAWVEVARSAAQEYEQVSSACQSELKLCKQRRLGVLVRGHLEAAPVLPAQLAASPLLAPPAHLRLASERYLREKLYFHRLDQPVLFQFNPVYSLSSRPGIHLQAEKYRGNRFGIGLKGINDLLGQKAADGVIRQQISIFSSSLREVLTRKGFPTESVWMAQFVDRFSACCEQPVIGFPEIVELLRCLAAQFNAASDEIKISHLRASVVIGEGQVAGYDLFHQLVLTRLSTRSSILVQTDPPIEVRRNSSAALREGRLALERGAFASAQLLAERAGTGLEQIGQ